MEPGTARMDFEFERMSGDLVAEIEATVNRELAAAARRPGQRPAARRGVRDPRPHPHEGQPPARRASRRSAPSRSSASTSRPTAGPMSRTPGRSARSGSPGTSRRDGSTSASGSRSRDRPPAGGAWRRRGPAAARGLGRRGRAGPAQPRTCAGSRSHGRCSVAAEWAIVVALLVYAYDLGGAIAVGLLGVARTLPTLVGVPIATTFADRGRRTRRSTAVYLAALSTAAATAVGLALDAGLARDPGDRGGQRGGVRRDPPDPERDHPEPGEVARGARGGERDLERRRGPRGADRARVRRDPPGLRHPGGGQPPARSGWRSRRSPSHRSARTPGRVVGSGDRRRPPSSGHHGRGPVSCGRCPPRRSSWRSSASSRWSAAC